MALGIYLGEVSVVTAELWAIHQGLSLAWSKGFRLLVTELGIRIIISLEIRSLLNRESSCPVNHICREANGCEDRLACEALNAPKDFVVFGNPPLVVRP